MADHPIIFNTEMVKAILDGRKTRTRRIIKPQPLKYFPEGAISQKKPPRHIWWSFIYPTKHGSDTHIYKKCPYGKVGDTLYIKESYRVCNMDMDRKQALMVHYYSDRIYKSVVITNAEMKLWKVRKKPFAKTPGRFMYKSLARIFLEITNIRVERVQEISNKDAIKEGIEWSAQGSRAYYRNYNYSIDKPEYYMNVVCPKTSFETLWDSINAKRGYGWNKNSFVWVIEFSKLTEPS